MDNRIILEKIAILIRQKSIKLELNKVKSHTSDKWNNEADRLAKAGRKSYIILDLNRVKSNNFSYNIA